MSRREFLKRIAAAAALVALGFRADERPVISRPSAGLKAGAIAERMVLGGNLFNAYAHGASSVSGPTQKLKLSQTRFSAGWKMPNGPGLQQLL